MNWDAIGAIGETVGALAVLVTLIYLARQVSAARREQQVAAIRANRNERREYFTSARDSPYLPGILSKAEAGGELSSEEEQRLRFHHAAQWGLIYSEWIQNQLALHGDFATSVPVNVGIVLSQPGAGEWFQEYGDSLYPSRFVEHVAAVRQELESENAGATTGEATGSRGA